MTEELLPLRTGFDLAWPGYRRDQVHHYVQDVEREWAVLAVDRDAAVARADDLAARLEDTREENRSLRCRLERIARSPIELEAATERARLVIEHAHIDADEIRARAQAMAEQNWSTARDLEARLRHRHEWLVHGFEAARLEMEAEHTTLMRQAYDQVATMTQEAEQRRNELDDRAAQLRQQIMADFDTAMAARRAEATRRHNQIEAAAEARATQMVAEAMEQVRVLNAFRDRVVAGLIAVRDVLDRAESRLGCLTEARVAKVLTAVPDAGSGAERR